MTASDIVDGIIEKKALIGMTNQQLSDASRQPKTTIDRILRKETANPSIQVILDMAAAVGYTFSNHPEQLPAAPAEMEIKDPMVRHLVNVYENRGKAYEERIKGITSHFNMLLAEKNRWLIFSLTLNVILVVFLCIMLILDATNPDIGWIRDQLERYNTGVLHDIFVSVEAFLNHI